MTTYYYISDVSYEDDHTIENILDQNRKTGVIIYDKDGVFTSNIINDAKYCYLYDVDICPNTIILNTKYDGILITNKIKIKNKTYIWTNYNLCSNILKSALYFSKIPFNIDPSIIDESMVNLMVGNNSEIIFKYLDDERFCNERMLFFAIEYLNEYIYISECVYQNGMYGVPTGNNLFFLLPEKYKTKSFCEKVCSHYPNMINLIPEAYKNNEFYDKIASIYLERKNKIDWQMLPQNIEVYESFYKIFCEIYNANPIIPNHLAYQIKKIDCLIWLTRKNPKMLSDLPQELLKNNEIKKIIEENKLINKMTNYFQNSFNFSLRHIFSF